MIKATAAQGAIVGEECADERFMHFSRRRCRTNLLVREVDGGGLGHLRTVPAGSRGSEFIGWMRGSGEHVTYVGLDRGGFHSDYREQQKEDCRHQSHHQNAFHKLSA